MFASSSGIVAAGGAGSPIMREQDTNCGARPASKDPTFLQTTKKPDARSSSVQVGAQLRVREGSSERERERHILVLCCSHYFSLPPQLCA